MEGPLEIESINQSRDEDSTSTTERELRGWFSYGLAAEVFAVCGVGRLSSFVLLRHMVVYMAIGVIGIC